VLSHCSQSLKHLFIRLKSQVPGEELSSLQFPNLEVLELTEGNNRFPAWMVVPPTLKLYPFTIFSNIPAIQEVWVHYLYNSRSEIGFGSGGSFRGRKLRFVLRSALLRKSCAENKEEIPSRR